MKEDLEQEDPCAGRGLLTDEAVCAHCCVHGLCLPRASTEVMRAQHGSQLSCLNHKSLSYCSSEKKYRSRTLPFVIS